MNEIKFQTQCNVKMIMFIQTLLVILILFSSQKILGFIKKWGFALKTVLGEGGGKLSYAIFSSRTPKSR